MIKDLMSLTIPELTSIIQGSTVKDSLFNNFNGGSFLLSSKQAVSRKAIEVFSENLGIAAGVQTTFVMGGDPGTNPVNAAPFYLGWFDHRCYSSSVAFTAGDVVVAHGITGPATAQNLVYGRRKFVSAALAGTNQELYADFPPNLVLFQTWRLTTNVTLACVNYEYNFRGIQISTN